MNTIDDLVALVRDELGLPVTVETAGLEFDSLPGWDSVHLLWLLTVLEERTGRSLSMPDLLEAASLESVYALVAAP
ncbi:MULTISPECIES: acyl carrier protein [unclassified Actinomadura]|uniref:acyl carrier protein n=1 Tax=unclassified Actinomadura TaxID=2626254 RepID=UPI0011EF54D6|nr:acyl carrier protein [Actinomadura sp. K4S16]